MAQPEEEEEELKPPTREMLEAGDKAMALYYATADKPSHAEAMTALYVAMRKLEK